MLEGREERVGVVPGWSEIRRSSLHNVAINVERKNGKKIQVWSAEDQEFPVKIIRCKKLSRRVSLKTKYKKAVCVSSFDFLHIASFTSVQDSLLVT